MSMEGWKCVVIGSILGLFHYPFEFFLQMSCKFTRILKIMDLKKIVD